jgi:hypothetical protein
MCGPYIKRLVDFCRGDRVASGKGTWSVVDAPGNMAQLFAFTLNYDVSWTSKGK